MKNKNLKNYFEEFDNKFYNLKEIDRNFYEKEIRFYKYYTTLSSF